jgi:2-(1,2-epoxy-1,2-dihydrophenyl)acetyl-CoA isomerase
MHQAILFEISGGAARLTLNRPDRLNSFNEQMHADIARAFDAIDADASVRVLLLTGAGRGFCAGQDLSDVGVSPADGPVNLGDKVQRLWAPLIRRLVGFAFPTVCAVNGVAAGAGASIAIACDLVLAAKGAKFIQSFAGIGLVPDSGATWHLPRLIGQARALGITMTGQPVGAEQAEQWGLIWRAVDDDKLMAEADALVAKFAKAPTLGLARTKQLIRSSWSKTLDQSLDAERDGMHELGSSADYAEGIAAFLAKRPPNFTGR